MTWGNFGMYIVLIILFFGLLEILYNKYNTNKINNIQASKEKKIEVIAKKLEMQKQLYADLLNGGCL
jgi:hypothetical protein